MALQFRRGAAVDRTSITPAEGELLYVTDHVSANVSPVWIGDGSTAGGLAVSDNAPGLAGELAIYSDNGTRISGTDSGLLWDSSTKKLTITGTSSVVSEISGLNLQTFDSYYSDGGINSVQIRRARGTIDAPESIINDDYISNLSFQAHDGTGFVTASNIFVRASGAVSTGVIPTSMFFTGTGTDGVRHLRLRISAGGVLFVGPSRVTDSGSGRLFVWQVESGYANSAVTVRSVFSDNSGPTALFQKARGFNSSPESVQAGDLLSTIRGTGYDGVSYPRSAEINMSVSSVPSVGVLPGKITFGIADSAGQMNYTTSIDHTRKFLHQGPVELDGPVTVTGNAFKLAQLTSFQRDALIPTGGELIYNVTVSKIQGWQSSGWFNLDGTPFTP